MSRGRVVLCRVEDVGAEERTREVARFDLPDLVPPAPPLRPGRHAGLPRQADAGARPGDDGPPALARRCGRSHRHGRGVPGAAATAPPDPRRPAPLDAWITDLEARRTAIPCERERHRQRQDSGSGHAAKANDLRVARRQKNQGLHGSEETSVALMRLRTLRLNGDWDRYWQQQTFPSLLAA